MRRRPKAKGSCREGAVAICPRCGHEVPLYCGRFSIHGAALGQGLCPGAGEDVQMKASRREVDAESTRRPQVGPELLDLMQTIPVFAYLVPILVLFGFGPVAAVVATIIYALPPMTRITMLALRGVPGEVLDLGRMVGCTRRQNRRGRHRPGLRRRKYEPRTAGYAQGRRRVFAKGRNL